MTGLAPVPPQVVAEAVDALPSRLRSRLDEAVRTARDWPVTVQGAAVEIRVDADVTVHMQQTVRSGKDVRCTCLLAPRCLHRAAVLSLAPTADSTVELAAAIAGDCGPADNGAGDNGAGDDGAGDDGPGGDDLRPVSAAETRAADALWRAAASVLETGIPGAGAVTQASLLRAAHDARAVKLHRGAAAAIGVVEHLRAAATEDPSFRLADLVGDLRDLLSVAHRLRQRDARIGSELRGTARREYRVAPGARLYGLCVEPVATASGYAGAVTLLADATGTVWQVSTVVPGGPEVARFAARRPVSVGEVRLNHTDLGREGLLANQVSASADGRIGSGKGTSAVAANGVTWVQPPLDMFWQAPWEEQVDRYLAARELPPAQRPTVAGLLFVDATVLGAAGAGVALLAGGRELTAVAAHDSPELTYVDNLRLLARVPGAAVRVVARPVGRRRLAPIAFAAPWLPPSAGGHVDLGLDRLRRTDLPGVGETAAAPARSEDQPPPVHPLRRQLERAVEGGRAAVPGDPREVERLRAALPYAAELASRLEAASRPRRDAFGRVMGASRLAPDDHDRPTHAPSADDPAHDLARAWLAAATYLHGALRSAERDGWLA